MTEPALMVEDLSINFGGLRAVDEVTLSIAEGERRAIIGPNGAGKTTVFNLITGVYRPTQGKIVFQDQNLIGHKTHEIISMGIARTFQNVRLFKELSVLDNVRIAHYTRAGYSPWEALFRLPSFRQQEARVRKETLDLLKIFGLDSLAAATAKNLPYGQQRRLEIARALAIRRPAV